MRMYDMTLEEAGHLIAEAEMVVEQKAGSHDTNEFVTALTPKRAKDILLHLWKNREDLRLSIMLAKAEIEFENKR